MNQTDTDEIIQKHILLKLKDCRDEGISFSVLVKKIYARDIIPSDRNAVKENLMLLHDNGFVRLEDINPKDPDSTIVKITNAGLMELKNRLT